MICLPLEKKTGKGGASILSFVFREYNLCYCTSLPPLAVGNRPTAARGGSLRRRRRREEEGEGSRGEGRIRERKRVKGEGRIKERGSRNGGAEKRREKRRACVSERGQRTDGRTQFLKESREKTSLWLVLISSH